MKLKLRSVSLIICAMILISVLSGCAQNDNQGANVSETDIVPAQTQSGEPAVSTLYPLVEETAALTIWTVGETDNIDGDFTNHVVWRTIMDAANVELKFTVISMMAATETFNIMAVSGEYTDLLSSVSSLYPGGIGSALNEEIIIDLSPYLDEYMPDYKTVLESSAEYMKSVKDDNGQIGLGASLIQAQNPVTNGPVIRQDWLDALELDAPVTYDDYYDVLTAFKLEMDADAALWIPFMGSIAGSYLAAGYNVASYSLAGRGEAPFYQIDGSVKFGPAEQGYKQYLETLNLWYSEGLIYKDFYSENDPRLPNPALILENRTGIWYDMTSNMVTYEPDDPDFKISAIQDAVQKAGDVNHLRGGDSVIDTGSGLSVSSSCKIPEIAAGFINYNYTEEGITLTNYGVENLSYVLGNDGNPYFTELITKNPDGLTLNEALSTYTMSKGNVFEDGLRNYQIWNDTQSDAARIWAASDTEYMYPVGAGMTAEESEIYSKAYSEVSALIEEMTLKFIVGEESLDKFDSFVGELYALGLQTCVDLKQAALTRYNER